MPEVASKVAQEVQAGRPPSSDVVLGAVANTGSLLRADAAGNVAQRKGP